MARRIALFVFLAALVPLTGCGGVTLLPTQGVVTLDGKPVEGATVVFTSPDGKTNASGMTDAAGAFTLSTGEKLGAAAGTYKVTVSKYAVIVGAMSPSQTEGGGMNKDYLAAMKKEAPKGGGGNPMAIPKGGAASGGAKTELPDIYATVEKTPLSNIAVPSAGPIKLELKSKP